MKRIDLSFAHTPSRGNPRIEGSLNRKALLRMLERAKELSVDLHAFEVWKDNELRVRFSLPPYDCRDKRLYYSLSKSFVSTAIGLACDEGLLTTDTLVTELFPDRLPETISENLKKLRVSHILSMNSGVEKETTRDCFNAPDVAAAFLSADFKYEPGTHYLYDTGATAMLAAIVRKMTGESALDYLDRKLFREMDITDVYWDRTADGTIQGGTGLHASCDDAAKLGLLYLNRGLWNGKRLLSEAWVDEASSIHSDNSPSDWPDWRSGYCYQFWHNSRGGYRGDGAFGQYSFILPDLGIVAAALCEAENLQHAVDIVHETALALFEEENEGDVETAIAAHYAPEKTAPVPFAVPRYFKAEENALGISTVKLSREGDAFVFAVSNGLSLTSVRCGNGEWIDNRTSAEALFAPAMNAQTSERTAGLSAAYSFKSGRLTVELRSRCTPHHYTVQMSLHAKTLRVALSGLTAGRLPQKELVLEEI